MTKSKNNVDKLLETMRLAEKNGMTYSEFQQKESLGLARIVGGKLLLKGRDY